MNSSDEFQRIATHYTDLAQQPGWWDYCRHRVSELEQDQSGLYVGLRAEIRKRLETAKATKLQGLQNKV
jgi:hypothetical protein